MSTFHFADAGTHLANRTNDTVRWLMVRHGCPTSVACTHGDNAITVYRLKRNPRSGNWCISTTLTSCIDATTVRPIPEDQS